MARKSALNIDALAALGPEKLAKLVLDEAGHNAGFRKVVSAALASSKGPEAIAKIVDRRLSALERARSFIEIDKAKAFEKDLSATVKVATEELGQASPEMAIERLLRFIATHEKVFDRVEDSHGRVQDVYYLQQCWPNGTENSLTIIAEAGDLRRFRHHHQFLKFCGLDLSTQQFGQFRGHTRLSKFGNARLRRTHWIAGQVAIRQRENGFRHKFERYIARDRDNPDLRRKAMTAITAKMAHVVHTVIKSGSDYRPFVEGRVPGGRTSVS